MLQRTRRAGHCAAHTLQVAEWLAPSVSRHSCCRPFSIRRLRAGTKKHKAIREANKRSALSRWPNGVDNVQASMERDMGFRLLRPGASSPHKYAILEKIIMQTYEIITKSLQRNDTINAATRASWGIKSDKHLAEELDAFRWRICASIQLAEKGTTDSEGNYLFYQLRHAFIQDSYAGLQGALRYALMSSILKVEQKTKLDPHQQALVDMRYPMEWFPATRSIRRKIHLHVGPTNSGKTYHALQRLEQAERGIYAGPLRLLAHEVYTRFSAKGIPCALITGEERRLPEEDWKMKSCTVEMVPLNDLVDVAVIDEIQMLGDPDRGWAWTQAFLGVRAHEVHLCGEARTVPLIRALCAAIGDDLEVHEYNRLSPLKAEERSLAGNIENLRKGDAVILFSRVQLHAMKKHIEDKTGRRCAIVYGSLPPETRAQQASLFNDPDNDYDFLVASDAVGMGLNLSIKRVVFDSTWKHNGFGLAQLTIPEVKQIGGRAGRYRTTRDATVNQTIDLTDGVPVDAQPPLQVGNGDATVGYVTALEDHDLTFISTALEATPKPLEFAYILPPNTIVERFAAYFPPSTPFSYILLRINETATLSKYFKLCRLSEPIEVADHLKNVNLTISDNINFVAAPVQLSNPVFSRILIELAECVAQRVNVHILDLKSMPYELLGMEPSQYQGGEEAYLRAVEVFHKAITLYLWLSYRFASIFTDQAVAFHLKALIEEKINNKLRHAAFDGEKRKKMQEKRKKAALRQLRKAKMVSGPELARELAEGVARPGAGEDPVPGDVEAPDLDDVQPQVAQQPVDHNYDS